MIRIFWLIMAVLSMYWGIASLHKAAEERNFSRSTLGLVQLIIGIAVMAGHL